MKNRIFKIIAVLVFIVSVGCNATETKTEIIKIKHTKGDMTLVVRNAIENAKTKDIKLVFEKGNYFFKTDYAVGKYLYVTNHGNGFKKIIFNFEEFNSVEIEGNNSEFIF